MLIGDQRGFSLLEALVASLMSVLVVGGMLVILVGLGDVHRDQQQLIDAQMTSRLALEQMQRDIQQAGIGLLGLLAPLPVIEPRDDGGIDIRSNADNLTARFISDQADPGDHLKVDDATGFEIGMVIAVYDGTGSFDLATITDVKYDTHHLHFDGTLSKTYTVAGGTAVKRVRTVSYYLVSVNGVFSLQRQEDDSDAQPVAINVRSMNISYFNTANPPQAFTPLTLADQLLIRVIAISLEVETEDVRLNTTQERTVTQTIRITPRSVLLAS